MYNKIMMGIKKLIYISQVAHLLCTKRQGVGLSVTPIASIIMSQEEMPIHLSSFPPLTCDSVRSSLAASSPPESEIHNEPLQSIRIRKPTQKMRVSAPSQS